MEAGSDDVELGGNIILSGFREIDGATMIILKKIVGNYAKKFSERCANFEKLILTIKTVHRTEKSEKYEMHGKLLHDGKQNFAEEIDRNLFVAADKILKRLENSILNI